MPLSILRTRVAKAAASTHLPVCIRDAVRDLLTTHNHQQARIVLRRVVDALRTDGSRPDLTREFELILEEEK